MKQQSDMVGLAALALWLGIPFMLVAAICAQANKGPLFSNIVVVLTRRNRRCVQPFWMEPAEAEPVCPCVSEPRRFEGVGNGGRGIKPNCI